MRETLSALNPLKYTGVVTLSQYIGSEKVLITKIHNEGTNQLFNYLADCLIGNYEAAKANRPAKIMLLKVPSNDTEDDTEITAASPFIYIRTLPEKVIVEDPEGLTYPAVRYSFIVSQEVISNKDFNAIGLFLERSTDITQYAARIDLKASELFAAEDSDAAALSNGASFREAINSATFLTLVLDWEIYITNSSR